MKALVVGCGSIGRRHIMNLLALGVPASDIVVRDVNPDRRRQAQQLFGVQADGDADVALICAPAQWHAHELKTWLRGSPRPFFLEKPATVGVADLPEEIWDVAVPHLVGCNMLFRPDVDQFIERVRGLEPSAVKTPILFACVADMTTWPGEYYTASQAFEFCHEVDLAIRACGSPEWRTFESNRFLGVEGVTISWRGTSGLWVNVELRWGSGRRYLRAARCDTHETGFGYSWSNPPADANQMYLDEMRHFLAVLSGQEASRNTLAMSRVVVDVCERASE